MSKFVTKYVSLLTLDTVVNRYRIAQFSFLALVVASVVCIVTVVGQSDISGPFDKQSLLIILTCATFMFLGGIMGMQVAEELLRKGIHQTEEKTKALTEEE